MRFELNEYEKKKFDKWNSKHECKFKDPSNQGAIGGRLTYEIGGTSLGQVVKAKCDSVDLSDYESW